MDLLLLLHLKQHSKYHSTDEEFVFTVETTVMCSFCCIPFLSVYFHGDWGGGALLDDFLYDRINEWQPYATGWVASSVVISQTVSQGISHRGVPLHINSHIPQGVPLLSLSMTEACSWAVMGIQQSSCTASDFAQPKC